MCANRFTSRLENRTQGKAVKTFKSEFDKILKLFKASENFAFSRFSDGELFIMQNKTVVLAKDYYITGDVKGPNIYTEEEQKEFLPARDQLYREKLLESYKYIQDNYFKGICTGTDAHVGDKNFDYQIELHGGDHETASNNIRDHLILCSAASLSNFVIYENFKEAPNNTYLDIGSCLNPLLKLEGWKHTRGYLTHYWLGSNSSFGTQVDQWGI